MKSKLLGLVLLIILNFTNLYCQGWLPIGTNWNYTNTTWGLKAGINNYEVIDEIEIKGKICSVIEKSNTSCDNRPLIEYLYKEDDKVFYYEESQDTFNLLYDFSLEEGDVFRIPRWESIRNGVALEDSIIYRIDSISEVNIGERKLKHFFIRSGGYQNESLYFGESKLSIKRNQIIEDIGSLSNLFVRVESGSCDGIHTDDLRCFTNPNYGLINFIDVEECDSLITVSIKQEDKKNKVEIYPTITKSHIQLKTYEYEEFNWHIIDLSGKIVKRGNIVNRKNIPTSIDLSDLNSSIYILVLKNTEGIIYIQKIIKN